jgi:hypothetical protein
MIIRWFRRLIGFSRNDIWGPSLRAGWIFSVLWLGIAIAIASLIAALRNGYHAHFVSVAGMAFDISGAATVTLAIYEGYQRQRQFEKIRHSDQTQNNSLIRMAGIIPSDLGHTVVEAQQAVSAGNLKPIRTADETGTRHEYKYAKRGLLLFIAGLVLQIVGTLTS